MTTATSKPDKRTSIRRSGRFRERGWRRTGGDHHKPWAREPLHKTEIYRDCDRPTEGGRPDGAVSRSAFISGVKAVAPVLFPLIPFAMAFGAAATDDGLSTFETVAMSVFVFAGAAQLAAVQLIAAGASVAVVVLTVLTINLRLTLYSASLAQHLGRLPAGWKGLLSYLLTDQAYAATITRFDGGETKESDKRWYFLGAALAVWIFWQMGTVTGVFLGRWVSEGWSLDFVLPLTFIALAFPTIKDRATTAAALLAGVAAVFAAALPLNLGLIAAATVGVLGGLAAQGVAERRRR
jgi:4-azaleucine resistance transporter AzlC